MTIRTEIHAVLAALAAGATFEEAAPDGQKPDYIVWNVVSADPQNDLDGGVPTLNNLRLQVDCWGVNLAAAEALVAAVNAAMHGAAPFKALQINELDAYAEDVKGNGITLEFSIWTN